MSVLVWSRESVHGGNWNAWGDACCGEKKGRRVLERTSTKNERMERICDGVGGWMDTGVSASVLSGRNGRSSFHWEIGSSTSFDVPAGESLPRAQQTLYTAIRGQLALRWANEAAMATFPETESPFGKVITSPHGIRGATHTYRARREQRKESGNSVRELMRLDVVFQEVESM